jgi:hypothetical protein
MPLPWGPRDGLSAPSAGHSVAGEGFLCSPTKRQAASGSALHRDPPNSCSRRVSRARSTQATLQFDGGLSP